MFKIQPKPTFWAKVHVSVPGQERPATFEVEFRHLGREALRAYFASLEGRDDADALLEIVANWRGVDAEFNADNFAALLDNYPQAAMAIFQAYQREALEAREKN